MRRQRTDRGITLPEAMIAIAILGLVFGMARLGIDWMVSLGRQRSLLNAQWNAQIVLYDITRSIRNCKQIVSISSGTMELAVFRPSETSGFSNPAFVVTAPTATIRYEYVRTATEHYLQKTYISPTSTRVTKQLVNIIEEPVGASFLFKPYGVDQPGRYEAAEIVLRLRPAFWDPNKFDKPIEYRSISMKRTSTG